MSESSKLKLSSGALEPEEQPCALCGEPSETICDSCGVVICYGCLACSGVCVECDSEDFSHDP